MVLNSGLSHPLRKWVRRIGQGTRVDRERSSIVARGQAALLPGDALLALAAVSLASVSALGGGALDAGLLAATGAFVAMGGSWIAMVLMRRAVDRSRASVVREVIRHDPGYCFLTDAEGVLGFANIAADARFPAAPGEFLAIALREVFAGAEGVVYRLRRHAQAEGAATEDIASHAEGMRVHVRRMAGDMLLWRLDTESLRGEVGRQEALPSLLISRSGAILYMNGAARSLLRRRPKGIDELFADLPLRSGGVHGLRHPDDVRVTVTVTDIGAGRQELVLSPVTAPEAAESGPGSVDGGFDALPVPLLKLDPDGSILRANGEAARLLHLRQDVPGKLTEHMEGLGRALSDWLQEAADIRGLIGRSSCG